MKNFRRFFFDDAHWASIKYFVHTMIKPIIVCTIMSAVCLALLFFGFSKMKSNKTQIDYKTWAPDGYTISSEEVRASKGDTVNSLANDLVISQNLEGIVTTSFMEQAILKLNPEIHDPSTDFRAGELYTVPVYTLEETTGN